VAYCDATIAFPIFCEYVLGSERDRRTRKALIHRRGEFVTELQRQARVAGKRTEAGFDQQDGES